MKSIIWTVRIKAAPTAVRYCKRCGVKTGFVSSGLFRVNAQQKSLDVWLIYKCPVCDTTWNLTVLTRAAARSLPPGLLRGFLDNEPGIATRCASDAALIKHSGAEPGPPEIEITGEDAGRGEPVQIRIAPEQPLKIRAEHVLRKKLGLSRGGLDKALSSGRLVCVSGHDLKKCALSCEVVVELRPE
ncbi:MAG: DUF1062 domain-containing protein [Oscillospiraceae bacterium]|nr:DUF1062 domain-containing protein [Oscillospiraceae bacterium]